MTDGKNPTNSVEYIWDRLLDTFEMISSKMFSGRFLLTIVACVLLIKWGWSNADTMADKLINTVENIVIFYFLKNPDGNGDKNDKDIPVSNKQVSEPVSTSVS